MIKVLIFVICLFVAGVRPVFAEELPKVESQSAVLIDFDTGRVLWDKNSHEPMAMASTTKIMTAILTLEKGDLSDIVTVSRRAAIAPKVKMNLSTGEKIPLETLLYALMLQSSNDAAVAIAEHIGGTVEDFCAMMTDKAKEIGAHDTFFVTPNGLDEGDHHSTAYDMAIIARYALSNKQFLDIINTREVIQKSDLTTYHIYNKNRLLSEYSGANGVKTGYTGKAGHCFVGSAKRNDLWLISVVFASGWGDRGREQKWIDTKKILNYGFDNFKYETLVINGEIAGELSIDRSKINSIELIVSDGLRVPISEEEKNTVEIKKIFPESLKAPVYAGDKIGVCEVYIGGEKFAEIDILAAASAERHDLKTSMEKVLNTLFNMVTRSPQNIILPEF